MRGKRYPPTAVGWAWGFCLWGEKKLNRNFKAHGLRSMGRLFLIDEKEVQTHPPQWDGLGGSKKEEGNEGVG